MNESVRKRQFRARVPWSLLGLVIVLLGVILFIVVRPGPPGGGPRPGDASAPPGPPGPPGAADFRGKTKTARGLVVGFKDNPHLDYDAIQVNAGEAGMLTIDFRPHTARPVMDLAAVKDSVEVTYGTHPNDEAVGYVLVRVKNERTGKEVVLDELPPPPDVPPNHSAEFFTILNPELITDQYGGIVAIRNGHLLFHFKPGLVDDILPLIKTSRELGLSAVWRDDHFGFVNVDGDKVYVVLSVTIDNKTFLVR
jgi:hypothetical protein